MDQIQKLLVKLLRQNGSSRSKRLLRLVEQGEWGLLQKESLSPPHVYQNHSMYKRDAIVVELLRKCYMPSTAKGCREAAVETFWACEAKNAQTNARLDRYIGNKGPFDPSDLPVLDFISRWRKNVERVLGRLPERLNPRFSSGATLSDRGLQTTIPDKLSSVPTVYRGSLDVFRHSVAGTVLDRPTVKVVRSNKFFTVPKDSSKDRGCAVEASGAVILQLDIDRIWKKKYEKRYQVRFSRLPEYHVWLAQLASRHQTFATIDLSNASDTVCRKLVQLVFPSNWFELLNSLRAKTTLIDGKTVYLEKFSSMGNGFTFMLETILFRTLIETVGSKCGTVFGDDIIVESEYAGDTLAALHFFGFTPNQRKTFCEGPFRESCGGDFFNGEPVRAHYMKTLPDEPQHWVALANGLRRADPSMKLVSSAWHYCIDQLPRAWRQRHADEELGDAAIYDPQAKPRMVRGVPYWDIHVPIVKTYDLTKYFNGDVAIAAAVLGTKNKVPLRDQVLGYRRAKVIAYGTNWLPNQYDL